jgi:hypothetical protein
VSAAHRPLEPCAEVLLFRAAKKAKPQPTGVVVTHGNGQPIIRRGIGRVLGIR